MNTEETKKLYDQYLMATYKPTVVISKAKGSRVYDASGKQYYDMTSGIGSPLYRKQGKITTAKVLNFYVGLSISEKVVYNTCTFVSGKVSFSLSARADGQRVPVRSAINGTPLGPPDSLPLCKFQLVVLLHRTTEYVIPRRGEAPTWESPAP